MRRNWADLVCVFRSFAFPFFFRRFLCVFFIFSFVFIFIFWGAVLFLRGQRLAGANCSREALVRQYFFDVNTQRCLTLVVNDGLGTVSPPSARSALLRHSLALKSVKKWFSTNFHVNSIFRLFASCFVFLAAPTAMLFVDFFCTNVENT